MYEIDKQKFGGFVAARRKVNGWTQKELAQRLYVSDKAVSKWETGASLPDAALFMPLAELLGVSVTELLTGEALPPNEPMLPEKVETLVQKAITCAEPNPAQHSRQWRRRLVLFCLCAAAGGGLYLYACLAGAKVGGSTDTLLAVLLGGIFGGYFMLIAGERLPAYYDENKIRYYSDGFFHINLAFCTFNNKNWPHILRVGRIWSMGMLVGYPLLQLLLGCVLPPERYRVEATLFWVAILGGLMLPMLYVAKKYE